MKTQIERLNENKDLQNAIGKVSYYTTESFLKDARRWALAVKEGRMICNIESVSRSGMSRNMKFLECTKSQGATKYIYLNFFAFMMACGFSPNRNTHCFKIGGCGMDMVFHVNYTIIQKLFRLGIILAKDAEKLAQMTPQIA